MVGPLGHVGVALLVSAPAIYLNSRREGLLFTLFAVAAGLLPDADASLPWLSHHGVTHTLLFAVSMGLVGGAVVAGSFVLYQRATGGYPGEPTPRRILVLTTSGLFVGATSHVLVDALLILPAGARPVAPLWPVWRHPIQVELLPPFSNQVNLGLLFGGIVVCVGAYLRS